MNNNKIYINIIIVALVAIINDIEIVGEYVGISARRIEK